MTSEALHRLEPRLAYVHAIPDAANARDIFYVGKGSLNRARNFASRSPEHKAVTAQYGSSAILVGILECQSEDIALELECGLIKCLRRVGAPLVNKTAGGGGMGGFKHSPEARRKISEAKKGERNPMRRPEVAAKAAASHALVRADASAKRSRTVSDPVYRSRIGEVQRKTWENPEVRKSRVDGMNRSDVKAKVSQRLSENNPSLMPEVRIKRSVQFKAMWAEPGKRESLSASFRAAWTDERKAALSANNPSHSPEVNVKKSAKLKGYKWKQITCPHCDLTGAEPPMKRYHFDNCKKRGVGHASLS